MKHLNYFKDDFLLIENYKYADSLIVEEIDVKKYLHSVIDRVRSLPDKTRRKILIYALTSITLSASAINIIKHDDKINQEILSDKECVNIINNKIQEKFKFVDTLYTSEKGIEHIKYEEGDMIKKGEPVLKAYKLGDGKITIGWGHAEDIHKTKLKIGKWISKEIAERLFKKDIKVSENGVKRIFKEWSEKGIDRKITQDMFDILVSYCFNNGVGSLRISNFIQEIKKGDIEKAGILLSSASDSSKFDGVKLRRDKESKIFLSYLNESMEEKLYRRIEKDEYHQKCIVDDNIINFTERNTLNQTWLKKSFPKIHFKRDHFRCGYYHQRDIIVVKFEIPIPQIFTQLTKIARIISLKDDYFIVEIFDPMKGIRSPLRLLYYLIDGEDGMKQFFSEKIPQS